MVWPPFVADMRVVSIGCPCKIYIAYIYVVRVTESSVRFRRHVTRPLLASGHIIRQSQLDGQSITERSVTVINRSWLKPSGSAS